ncbi:hypothetical protein Tco_0796996 [Tanacetum coccineum]
MCATSISWSASSIPRRMTGDCISGFVCESFFVGGTYGVEEGMFCMSPELIVLGVKSLSSGPELNSSKGIISTH